MSEPEPFGIGAIGVGLAVAVPLRSHMPGIMQMANFGFGAFGIGATGTTSRRRMHRPGRMQMAGSFGNGATGTSCASTSMAAMEQLSAIAEAENFIVNRTVEVSSEEVD